MANNNNIDSRSSSGIGDSEGEQSGIECVGESNILRFNQFSGTSSTSYPPPRPPPPPIMWRSKSIEQNQINNSLNSSFNHSNETEENKEEKEESQRVLDEICWFKNELERMNVALMSVDDNNDNIEQQQSKNNNECLEKVFEKEEPHFVEISNNTKTELATFATLSEEKEENVLVDSWSICQEKQLQQNLEDQKRNFEGYLMEQKSFERKEEFNRNENISDIESANDDIVVEIAARQGSNIDWPEIVPQKAFSDFNKFLFDEIRDGQERWNSQHYWETQTGELQEGPSDWTMREEMKSMEEENANNERDRLEVEEGNETEKREYLVDEEREAKEELVAAIDSRQEWLSREYETREEEDEEYSREESEKGNGTDEDEEIFIKNIAVDSINSAMREENNLQNTASLDKMEENIVNIMATQSAANIETLPLYDQQERLEADSKQEPLPSVLTSSRISYFPTSDESPIEPNLTTEFTFLPSFIDPASSSIFPRIIEKDDNFGSNILLDERQQKQILAELIGSQYLEKKQQKVEAIDFNERINVLEEEKIEEESQKYFSYGLTENKDIEVNNVKLLNNDEQQTTISTIHRVPTPISGPLLADFPESPIPLITTQSKLASQKSTTNTSPSIPVPPPPSNFNTSNSSFGSMFGQKTSSSSSGFSNMFGGKFSKLTTGKLKDAMQAAGEQLSAKAASAVEKANQAMAEATSKQTSSSTSTSSPSKRPHSSLGFLTTEEDVSQPSTSSRSLSLAQIDNNAIELPLVPNCLQRRNS
uniref:Uncharacterized protein n=1 Tax=Meloidogyne enterolobii TaxID=390850 RepID=A0A6V7WDD1_MELEN|nr:unnamed protein product [Meloidogyne enterolobii]